MILAEYAKLKALPNPANDDGAADALSAKPLSAKPN
jgi:hypothetical protein